MGRIKTMPGDMTYAQQLHAAHKARRARMYAAAYVAPEIVKIASQPVYAAPAPLTFMSHDEVLRCVITLQSPDEVATFKLDQIMKAVIEGYPIVKKELFSPCRLKKIVTARQIFYYLAKKHTFFSYPEIGRCLGGYNHTTVMHGVNRIGDRIASGDKAVIAVIETAEKLLGVAKTTKPTD
jgi:hypothetical protein